MRKGWGRLTLRTFGRSSHAGGNHSDGRSAFREIARHILDIEGMTQTEPHATFNIGTVRDGTCQNMVPAKFTIKIDMRTDDTRSKSSRSGQNAEPPRSAPRCTDATGTLCG